MDFTREPIIETVITPKEGCKLVVRSSKNSGQEEYFVDAVEVVCFGSALFYRTQERPKAFLVPVSDYEILEVREARMVLKNVGVERTIKIGGGKAHKEAASEKVEIILPSESVQTDPNATAEVRQDGRIDKKRDKRRHSRRRRGREDGVTDETEGTAAENAEVASNGSPEKKETPSIPLPPPAILTPPSTLISETLARYKDNELFKNAFYTKEEQAVSNEESSQENVDSSHSEDILEALAMQDVSLEPSEYGTLGLEDSLSNEQSKSIEEVTQETKENDTF